ncbi:MAG: hypothetical protein KDI60_17070, partial [Xanthomonadales bacterium]|nr:hypothetical protein [Xanthomonadales bacterium]
MVTARQPKSKSDGARRIHPAEYCLALRLQVSSSERSRESGLSPRIRGNCRASPGKGSQQLL